MNRGEVWTVSGGADYVRKPRPCVILQDDRFNQTASITICVATTSAREAPLLRVLVEPDERNGLVAGSRFMVDKISTVHRANGQRIGRLSDDDMLRLSHAILGFLGLVK